MIKIVDTISGFRECVGCFSCVNACPKHVIEMQYNEEGFLYPVIDRGECINCGNCIKVCPVINLRKIDDISKNDVKAFACINNDLEIRKESSSGGIFSALATHVIDNNGIVFGATFDSEWNVIHCAVDNQRELQKLRGSKYVQSSIGDCFKKVQESLLNNKLVLFSGTPCQIAGLKAYLRKDYDNLFTIDIICHGVPSPGIWKKYLCEKYAQYDIEKIEFRNKLNGWRDYSFCIKHKRGIIYKDISEELFMQGFLRNLYLRHSCYQCKFKTVKRNSDLTIADFWGVEKLCPDLSDNMGTSLVFVQSRKGRIFLENIEKNIVMKRVNVEEAVNHNKAMIESSNVHRNRKIFFEEYKKNNSNVVKLINKYYFDKGIRKRLSYILRNKLKLLFRK